MGMYKGTLAVDTANMLRVFRWNWISGRNSTPYPSSYLIKVPNGYNEMFPGNPALMATSLSSNKQLQASFQTQLQSTF